MTIDEADKTRLRRDKLLAALVKSVPFMTYLGVVFERHGDELTAVLDYSPKLLGPNEVPRLHGGSIAAFLEATAIVEVAWNHMWQDMEDGILRLEQIEAAKTPPLPKTISVNVNYLGAATPRRAFARAKTNRSGNKYASVQVEAWQDQRDLPFAMATCNFLMPRKP